MIANCFIFFAFMVCFSLLVGLFYSLCLIAGRQAEIEEAMEKLKKESAQ